MYGFGSLAKYCSPIGISVMRKLAIIIRFDGRHYSGYQVQQNAPTIAGAVQDSIERVFGSRLDIKGCSRTDAKVHANNYCICFQTTNKIPCEKVIVALNLYLPKDIAVTSCKEVPEDFHPRYSAKGKRYIYKIYNNPIRNPFYEDLMYHYPRPVDHIMLDEQAKDFIGRYDFVGFSNSGSSVIDTVRTINYCGVKKNGDIIEIIVEGDGFLYNMVRIIVGTLLDINRGKIERGSIKQIIESKDRTRAGVTAPPHGLYLDEVFYD